jgi:hypothetical protein
MFNLNLIFGNKYLKQKTSEERDEREIPLAASQSQQDEVNCCTSLTPELCSSQE